MGYLDPDKFLTHLNIRFLLKFIFINAPKRKLRVLFAYLSYGEYARMISIFYYRFWKGYLNVFCHRITIIVIRDLKIKQYLKSKYLKLWFVIIIFYNSTIGVIFWVDVTLSDRKGFTVFRNVLFSVIFFTSRLL